MEGMIRYIIVGTYDGTRPTVYTTPGGEAMHNCLMDARRTCSQFRIIRAQRCVVTVAGQTTFTEVNIAFDEDGVSIRDQYWCLIDCYTVPQPEPEPTREFWVERRETWVNKERVRANTPEEAVEFLNQDVEDGGFDVLDGWCEDVATYVIEEIKKED